MAPTDAPAPRDADGWPPLAEHGYRLEIPAHGPIRFPIGAVEDWQLAVDCVVPLVPDTPYRDDEIADKLADALERASSLSVRDSALEPLYIRAEPAVEIARLRRVLAVVPTSMAPRLVVGADYLDLRADGALPAGVRDVGALMRAFAGQ